MGSYNSFVVVFLTMNTVFQYLKFIVMRYVCALPSYHGNLCLLNAAQWQRSESLIKHASPDADAMLLNGKAPLPGQIMKFPDLAKTFRKLVEHGKDGFYKGPVAEAIVELIQNKGGVMELEDLAIHQSTFVEPIKYTYADDVTIYEVSNIDHNALDFLSLLLSPVPTQWSGYYSLDSIRDIRCFRVGGQDKIAFRDGA